MKVPKILLLFFLVLAVAGMTGCWNYRELDTLAIVSGFSVDAGNGGKGYHLAFEVLDVSGNGGSGSSGGGGSSPQNKIIESDGDTIFDAVRNAIKESSGKLYFSDCKALIISHQLASKGIAPIIEWVNQDSEPRLTLNVFISEKDTAKDIITLNSPLNALTSFALDDIVQDDASNLSKVPYVQLYNANDMLGGTGISLILPSLNSRLSHGSQIPELSGTAVFKKDKLLGFIDSDSSKYILFIRNLVKGGLLLINATPSDPLKETLEIKKSNTNVTPLLSRPKPKIDVRIRLTAALGEVEGNVDFQTPDEIDKIESAANRTLESSIRQVITNVQNKYDSDVFGFGQSIYQNNPSYWNRIKANWDKIFKSLDVDVSADIEIHNTALTKSRVKVGD